MTTHHGTVVEIGGWGVLLRGAPGSGKSSLALRLIDAEGFGLGNKPLRARLVADDQFLLAKSGPSLVASPPAQLAGLLEIRGLGLVNLPYLPEVSLNLVVELGTAAPRMPEAHELQTVLEGVVLKRIMLEASDSAALAKIRASLF
jgi:serine kinase of HPr protein (carbohydrate metabolism regulator)